MKKIALIATIALFCTNIATCSTWVNPPQPPESNIRPGFVAADTKITLSCKEEGTILYTLDGSNPITSAFAQTYNNEVFIVPEEGALLIKAVVKISDVYSPVASLVWLPQEPLQTPFWGLNVSLALNGEHFGYQLSEAATRERILPIVPLTKWVRTFGTINNGQEYINKIAKELGLYTMIGLYITSDAANNNAQIEGLWKILETGPTPDLIAVGNETSLLGVNPEMLASCIDAVREMILEQHLIIPVGTVDIANISLSQSVVENLDFFGFNTYCATWDNMPEDQMLDATIQTYANTLAAYPSKLILLTETGTPYNGGEYTVPGGTQTPSEEKAANYLCGFLNWIKSGDIPAFYFEAYDEPVKSQNGGHPIEEFFGIMDGNMQIHPFYCDCIPFCETSVQSIHSESIKLYPNPTTDKVFLETECNIKVYNAQGTILQELFGNQVDLSEYPQGVYLLQVNDVSVKVRKQ